MRRLAASATVVIAAGVVALLGMGASSAHHKTYDVSARFDDAAFISSGEDVRVAGVNVGSVGSLDVTRSQPRQAIVTLQITNRDFQPFHQDATCSIRPQSLIGEKYVDCNPGTASAPPLPKIKQGLGAGNYFLPVTRTHSPIDQDIVNDIYREPIRQQLAIIIDEFGTGLAGRGTDLNTVIHRANPSLGYTDEVFQILARQNRQLAQLARDSDTVLAPLAKVKNEISGFVTNANATSVASAERANDISRSFQLFPEFLRQLRPLMVDLGGLADQGTPLMTSLSQSAAALNQQFTNLVPFAGALRTSLIALGNASAQSQPALLRTIPLDQRLLKLGNATAPTAASLERLLSSLDQTGGFEQLMALLLNGTTAANGFDSLGHYVRLHVTINGNCTDYTTSASNPLCSSNFKKGSGAAADVSTAAPPTHAGSAPAVPTATASKANRRAIQAASTSGAGKRLEATLHNLLGYLTGSNQ